MGATHGLGEFFDVGEWRLEEMVSGGFNVMGEYHPLRIGHGVVGWIDFGSLVFLVPLHVR